jgi:Alanine-zipper, major outer membrane lipoprotein
MRVRAIKSPLFLAIGAALLLSGCATRESVERAQSTADTATTNAAAAMSAAQTAESDAQAAMQAAKQAQAAADAANDKVDKLAAEKHTVRRHHYRHHRVRHHHAALENTNSAACPPQKS